MSVLSCKKPYVCYLSLSYLIELWLIHLPVTIFCLIKYKKFRRNEKIRIREYKINHDIIIYGLIFTLILSTYIYIIIGLSLQFKHNITTLNNIIIIIFNALFYVYCICITLRVWLIYYKINLNIEQSKCKWRNLLTNTNLNLHWFIKNHPKYGQLSKILIKYWVIYGILTLGIYITINMLHTYVESFNSDILYNEIIYISLFVPILIFIITCTINIPNVYDKYSFKPETKYILILVIMFIINNITHIIIRHYKPKKEILLLITSLFVTNIIMFLYSISTTYIIMNKLSLNHNQIYKHNKHRNNDYKKTYQESPLPAVPQDSSSFPDMNRFRESFKKIRQIRQPSL